MYDMWAMSWGPGLLALLVLVLIVLAIAALVKFLLPERK